MYTTEKGKQQLANWLSKGFKYEKIKWKKQNAFAPFFKIIILNQRKLIL